MRFRLAVAWRVEALGASRPFMITPHPPPAVDEGTAEHYLALERQY